MSSFVLYAPVAGIPAGAVVEIDDDTTGRAGFLLSRDQIRELRAAPCVMPIGRDGPAPARKVPGAPRLELVR